MRRRFTISTGIIIMLLILILAGNTAADVPLKIDGRPDVMIGPDPLILPALRT